MSETYYIGAYWGARKEDAEACAQRLATMVQELAPVDPLFASWFKGAKSLKLTLQRPLELELSSIRQYLQRNLMRDDRRQPMEDLGFSVTLWNGSQGGNDVWLNIGCGGYWEQINNRCVLEPPDEGPGSERVLTTPFQVAALRAIATAWDPDWGVATSRTHRQLLEQKKPAVWVGWVTYLSHRQGQVPPLPAPVRIEPVEDLGTLVILTPERFTASNPEHLALAERVRELLDRAGLLQRKPPAGT
ncbi:immunity 52 family protein [Hyalangium versicolor]|uniref:immunity 52 family protein n=1 Tax=Hyalangium versicolor TaxID=2861190 RepID=UPI001CD03FAF|nr:immunity 52 family protein [Hyalangium versicolor]